MENLRCNATGSRYKVSLQLFNTHFNLTFNEVANVAADAHLIDCEVVDSRFPMRRVEQDEGLQKGAMLGCELSRTYASRI